MDWSLNKQNKVPLYLQLKDLIKYSISTGALQHKQQLPTVHGLAPRLGVNFETVRKAYKDLEREGLVCTERGRGTFVTSHAVSTLQAETRIRTKITAGETLKQSVRDLLAAGRSRSEISKLVKTAIDEHEQRRGVVLFAECNTRQANDIAAVLRDYLRLEVRPVLLHELKAAIDRAHSERGNGISIITTGFHMKEVRHIVGERRIPIDFVMANMSPETRRQLDAYPKTARFGFVCRDRDSRSFYPEVLRAELGIKSPITACLVDERPKLTALLASVDVLLVAPSVYDTVQAIAPAKLPLFNIQDRVDPLSLKVLRDSLSLAKIASISK